ncbi:MAG: hypothetical protein J5887_05240 [Erysipelotrichaceae bacterium]|nr:hypothetical protein [Erysipelotrichaceae bacterium]
MKQLIERMSRSLLSLLLVITLIPVTAAAETETVRAKTDMSRQEMYDSIAYRALEYLGYDSSHILKDNGWTFDPDYVGSRLKSSGYWSSCRPQYRGKTLDYKEFTGSSAQVIDPADRDTVYQKGGFNCSQTAQYFVFGYLVDQLGYSFPGLANRTAVTINGAVGGFGSVYRLIRTLDDYISRYPDYCMRVVSKEKRNAARTLEVFDSSLIPGDIVCMWAPDDTYQHVAIYVGKYNGTHYLFHSGVVGRGPELITLDALVGQSLSSSSRADQESYEFMLADAGADISEGPMDRASGSSQNLYTAYRMLQPDGYAVLEKSIGEGCELCELAGKAFYSLASAQYEVYTDYSCSTPAQDSQGRQAVFVTDDDGLAQLRLPIGTYYVRETQAPFGFSLDDTVHQLTVTGQNTADNPAVLQVSDNALFDPFTLILTKKNGEGQVIAGAQFTLSYYNGDYDTVSLAKENAALRSWVLQTDANGRIRYDQDHLISGDPLFADEDGNEVLIDGTYVLEETLVPAHYSKAPVLLIRVRGSEARLYNEAGTVEIGTLMESGYDLRETATGFLRVLKESADSEFALDNPLTGTQYEVYLDSQCVQKADCEKLIIGEDGQSNAVELDPGTYFLRESQPAENYQLDETVYPVTIVENETVTVRCVDDPASGKLVILKVSGDEDYLSDHPLAGAEFSVYKDPQCTRLAVTLKIGDNGCSEEYELAVGTYYVRETLAPQDYLQSDEVREIEVVADQTLKMEFINDPALAPVGIMKIDSSARTPLPGAHLQLWDEEGTMVDEWISSVEPHLIWLSVGRTYVIRETESPEGYLLADDQPFTVGSYQGSSQIIEMENVMKEAVKTADPGGMPLYLIMMLASVNGMSFYVMNRRKDD